MTSSTRRPAMNPQWKRLAKLWPILPMLAVLCCLLLFDLDSIGYSPFDQDQCSLQEKSHSSLSEDMYRPLASWVFHTDPTRQVQVVTISAGSEPGSILTNTCDARLFLSGLLSRLSAAHAKVIVVDQYYSKDSCQNDADNALLVKAMADSAAPIVVGRPTHRPANASDTDSCLVLSDKFDLGPKVHYGLTRLNNDTLKIPLQWFVLNDDKQTRSSLTNGDSLSYVAAQLDDENVSKRPEIQRLLTREQHPYGSFLSQLPPIAAMQIFCAAGPADAAHTRWADACASLAKASFDVTGKTVVIGEQSDSDLQPFPGGDRYGVFIQADYIEAILHDRFLKEVPLSVTLSFLVAWLIFIYILFWFMKPEKAFLICLGIFAGLIIASVMALVFLTYYTPLWILWGAGVLFVFRYLDSRGHLLSEHMRERTFHEPEL